MDPSTGATAGGHISYMDKRRDGKWDAFVEKLEGQTPEGRSMGRGAGPVRQARNVAIEQLNVGREDSDGSEESEDEPAIDFFTR